LQRIESCDEDPLYIQKGCSNLSQLIQGLARGQASGINSDSVRQIVSFIICYALAPFYSDVIASIDRSIHILEVEAAAPSAWQSLAISYIQISFLTLLNKQKQIVKGNQ